MTMEKKKMNDVATVIFSKNRAMQLDSCLRTLFINCSDIHSEDINILFCANEHNHLNSYTELTEKYSQISFIHETSFKENLLEIVKNKKYIFFICDDAIFIHIFSLEEITNTLEENLDSLGFSLRLGSNIKYCYSLDKPQEMPQAIIKNKIANFNWMESDLDFNYPMEVSSSIYRTENLGALLKYSTYKNPNELESQLDLSGRTAFGKQYPFLSCYQNSVAFCNPVNKTQTYNNNRSGNESEYLSENLLLKFQKGERINIDKFQGFIPISPHQEVDFEFIKGD